MTVTVLGLGAGGRALAVHCALRGMAVTACERFDALRADLAATGGAIRYAGIYGSGEIPVRVVASPEDAAAASRLVFVATTAQGQPWALSAVAAAGVEGQAVVVLSGLMGSALWPARERNARQIVGETSVFPLSARLIAGECVIRRSFRPLLATLPGNEVARLARTLDPLLPCRGAGSIVETCLANPNPLIHAGTMLLNLAHIERAGLEAPVPLEGITPKAAALIDALDGERRAIAAAYGYALPGVDELYVQLTGRPPAFRTVETATPQPLQARFTSEDVPHGLGLWIALARAAAVEVPVMEAVMRLYAIVDPELVAATRTLGTLGLPEHRARDVLAAVGGAVHELH